MLKESVDNLFGYTGQQYDSITGQYYLRARYYNPVIGRFIQEDTYYGDGLNLYAYCGNNPVMYYDPSGYNKDVQFEKNGGDPKKYSEPEWGDPDFADKYSNHRLEYDYYYKTEGTPEALKDTDSGTSKPKDGSTPGGNKPKDGSTPSGNKPNNGTTTKGSNNTNQSNNYSNYVYDPANPPSGNQRGTGADGINATNNRPEANVPDNNPSQSEGETSYGKSIVVSEQKMYQQGQHYNKHGRDMGYSSKKAYEQAAREFFEQNKDTAEIYEGTWNSSRGGQGGERQIIIRQEGKQLIINKESGQIIDFYEGTSLDGFINIERMQ